MDAVEKFHEHCTNLAEKMKFHEEEQKKIKRQIAFFNDALEGYQMLNSPKDIENTRSALNILHKKLAENEQAIEALNIIPYAEAAMEELVERRNDIEDRLHRQHEVVIAARDKYLQQLQILGEIRDESHLLSWASRPVALKLRLNPLDEIYIGNRHDLSISQDEIDTYLSF